VGSAERVISNGLDALRNTPEATSIVVPYTTNFSMHDFPCIAGTSC